jgi:Ras-related protein Rab-11A
MEVEDADLLVKIVLIGDSGVGKTHLLSRFTRDRFDPESKFTSGAAESGARTLDLDNKGIKARFWSATGNERSRAVTSAYYRGAIGAMIVYDVTVASSFASVPRWLQERRENSDPNLVVMLVGNKTDLAAQRAVSTAEGVSFSKSQSVLFIETSAKDGLNVEEAFTILITEGVKKLEGPASPPSR